MTHRVVTLPGDGIGPELMAPALEVLGAVGDFDFEPHLFGGASIDAHGTALTDEVLEACRNADAVLLAAVGGPKWDTTEPGRPRPEQGLLALRKGLGLFANLRPVKPLPALYDASPLRGALIEGASLGGSGAGVFEPVHGSAPDMAGQGSANPLAMFLSGALLLRHGLGLGAQAAAVESAVEQALGAGLRTPDLGGQDGTAQA